MNSFKAICCFVLTCMIISCANKSLQKEKFTRDTSTFCNPLLPDKGPDPWAIWYNGKYYYMDTMQDSLVLWVTHDITDLRHATRKTIWIPTDPLNSKNLWAPEIHRINNKWYIYYSADDGNTENHQLYVLENANKDPLDGHFIMKGCIRTDKDRNWAIDASVFCLHKTLYMVWSGWQTRRIDAETQCIYLAKMKNPWTLSSDRVLISKPELDWEKHWINPNGLSPSHKVFVNEGPQPVLSPKENYIHIFYSASGCWTPYYSLGLLTASVKSDLLNPASWIKKPEPIFKQSPENRVYGPGHNCVFTSPNGKEYYILYHARDTEMDPPGKGDTRTPRAQRMSWDKNDFPVLGTPQPISAKLPKPSGTN